MFCANCGKELEDDAKFCEACGEKVEAEDVETQSEEEVTVTETKTEQVKEEIKEEPKPQPVKKEEPKPQEKPAPVYTETKKTPGVLRTKPLGIFSYIWMFILMSIPVVNIIMVLVWAFGRNKNVNKKNYAWAIIIMFIVFTVGGYFALGALGLAIADIYDSFIDAFESMP
jgi:cation transport ATPase